MHKGLKVLGALLLVNVASGCGSRYIEGISAKVCGTPIGRAEYSAGAGPVYLNASRRPPEVITAAARSAPIFVRVSPSCSQGAGFSVTDATVAGVSALVKAKDGAAVVLSISPYAPGQAVIHITPPRSHPTSLTLRVGPAVVPTTLIMESQ